MPIDPSLEHGVFEPEATAVMGEAFEAACRELHGGGDPEVRKLIAKRIFGAASRGELFPVRFWGAALSGVSITHKLGAQRRRVWEKGVTRGAPYEYKKKTHIEWALVS